MESKSERKIKFEHWLAAACGQASFTSIAMPGDASLRSYARIMAPAASYVAMDAPPPENCLPFVAIAAALRGLGLSAPEVMASDTDNGFLLLSDFGDATYLRALKEDSSKGYADDLYARALRALSVMQACRTVPGVQLQPFGREWMEREWVWHQEWFLQKWLGFPAVQHPGLNDCYEQLIVSALEQPQVFMHRDYHSANLMVLPEHGVGILDFQDAFMGPLTYDPASLLRDCYIDWPLVDVQEWALLYANLLRQQGLLQQVTDATFLRWFDWMGLQRHIKALMTFARKSVRDQQPRYLEYVPRTLNYIIKVSQQYPELRQLTDFYADTVQPAVKKANLICVP